MEFTEKSLLYRERLSIGVPMGTPKKYIT